MGKKYRWTEGMLRKFAIMRDAGYTTAAIAKEFNITNQQVYDQASYQKKKGNKDMSKYPPKRVKVDSAEVWRMFDEGKTRKEIAEHYGVSLQTICNRITAGRPKSEDPNTDEKNTDESWQAVPVKDDGPAAIDQTYENKGDTEMDAKTENAIMNTFCQGKVTEDTECTDNRPDILKIAAEAHSLATMVGFTPDHMMIHADGVRDTVRISGADSGGKVYELELTVTDPAKIGTVPPAFI